MSNVYQAPDASLDPVISTDGAGSVAKALAGDYRLDIGAVLSEAWAKTKGSKGTIWLAFLLVMLVIIPASIVPVIVGMVFGGSGAVAGLVSVLFQLAINVLMLPIMAGLWMIGIKRAAGVPVGATEIFGYFGKTVSLFLCMLLMYLLVLVGFILLVLPGIYLMVAFSMAMPLIVEKNMGVWEALQTSRKAMTHQWFTFFGLGIVVMLIYLVGGMFTLGIGLIWILPFLFLVMGVVYRTVFGYGA